MKTGITQDYLQRFEVVDSIHEKEWQEKLNYNPMERRNRV